MKNIKEKNTFLIACVSCIAVLLVMCYFGVTSSSVLKGTAAAGSVTYSKIETCTVVETDYYTMSKKCDKGVVSGSGCCPDAGFSYSGGSNSCIKNYDIKNTEISEELNNQYKEECKKNEGYTYYGKGTDAIWAQCSGDSLGKAYDNKTCKNDGVKSASGYCCPSDYEYFGGGTLNGGETYYCLKNGYELYNDAYGENGVGTGYICKSSGSASSSPSSSTPSSSCYCYDNDEGEETCVSFSVSPGGAWEVADSSKCSSSSTGTTCVAGKFYEGNGKCSTCPAGYYCIGGQFVNPGGATKCPDGTTSQAGSDSKADCVDSDDTYTIKYDANGGSGAPADQTGTRGKAVTISKTIPTRTGFTFKWWEIHDHKVTPGGSYRIDYFISDDDVVATLVAVWFRDSSSSSGNGDQTSNIGNTCGMENFGRWTKEECNAHYEAGYCHLWDSTNNCCSKTTGSCSGTNTGTGGNTGSNNNSNTGSNNNSNTGSNNNSNNGTGSGSNVNANPQTGEIAIFVVWVIALAMIVYSIWYFKKVREN